MDAIQLAALDLFDAHGFAAVTIDQVAERAQVSPSTIYRHFGTKEGLLIYDSSDQELNELLGASVDIAALIDWLRRSSAHLDGQVVGDPSRRRMRYIVDEPAVRAGAYAQMHQIATGLAAGLVASGVAQTRAHIWANAAISGLMAAYEQWYLLGDRPVVEYLDEAIALMTAIDLR